MPTENSDALRLTTGNYVMNAGGGDDVLRWTLTPGNYTFHGGDTNENYDSNVYGEKPGGDRLIIESKIGVNVQFTTTEAGRLDSGKGSTLNFTGVERLHLGDGNDVVNAGSARIESAHNGTPAHGLTIYAGDGHDRITGSRSGDFIDGGSGNDTIRAGDGEDFVQSSTGNDLIYGGGGNDNIRWGQGNFQEVVGNDTIFGGGGHDLINVWIKDGWGENSGGVAVNITKVFADGAMRGGAVTDIGGARSTLAFQGFEQGWTHEGRDTVSGANAELVGTKGIQWNTRWGDDRLTGSSRNDTLEGGEGADTIEGGRGNDLISAAESIIDRNAQPDNQADVLIFRQGFGHDTIRAFDSDLDILRIEDGMSYTARETSGGTQLTFNTGDTIYLESVFDFI